MMYIGFAIYIVGLLGALLTVGALSDHVGRRPVLLAAITVLVGAIGVRTLIALGRRQLPSAGSAPVAPALPAPPSSVDGRGGAHRLG